MAWNLADGRALQTFVEPEDGTHFFEISPCGTKLVTGASEG